MPTYQVNKSDGTLGRISSGRLGMAEGLALDVTKREEVFAAFDELCARLGRSSELTLI